MSKEYWEICLPEILEQNGVIVDEETLGNLVSDISGCAEVTYTGSPDVSYPDETEELKVKIKSLENRTPCINCLGKGGKYVRVGTSHASWDKCFKCNGSGWV